VRLALLDKKAGDPIVLHVQRNSGPGTEDLTFQIRLQ
jgi:hypothetical protein